MLRMVRLRHGRRRRFRDRVLVAMLVVALVPLAVFSLVVAAEIRSASSSTVDSANEAILADAENNQQTQLGQLTRTVAATLENTANQVRSLRDSLAAALRDTSPAPARGALPSLTEAGGIGFAGDDRSPGGAQPSAVLIGDGATAGGAARSPALAAAYRQTAVAEPAMEAIRGTNRAIQYVWIADSDTTLVRVLPTFSVIEAVTTGRLDPGSPLGGLGDASFSALASRTGDAAFGTWEAEQVGPSGQDLAPRFSTTYLASSPGVIGMTVSMAVGGGTHYRVGLDLDVRQLLGDLVTAPASDQRGAYNMLLDSSGRLLGGGDAVATDFALPHGAEWGMTLSPADPGFRGQLSDVLRSGNPATLKPTIAGIPRDILTSPIPSAHWMLASVVPLQVLLPEQTGLSKGIDGGVRRILRDAVIAALGLVVVAFVLASLLARRVVAPMGALTEAAERLGSGNTEVPVPAAGRDEVGLLAVSLERMRREVNSSRDAILAAARELEGRVEERTAELRDRNEELVALNALAGSLTRSLDPQVILEGAFDTLRVVLPMRAGRAFVLNEERLEQRVGWEAGDTAGGPGLHEADADALAGVARDAVDSHDLALRTAESGVLLGIPLETRDGALGAIGLLARPGWRLGGRSRALVRAVGDQVGLAMRTAALSAEGRELAVLEERTRLAREIHDTIAQQLTAIVLQLEAAEVLVPRDAARAQRMVVTARDQARSALHEARQSVWNLRPTPLDRTGLAGAIAIEASTWQRRSGIHTTVRAEELPRSAAVAPQSEVALFRILQEALTNVSRHSHASSVDVRLEVRGGDLVLRIRDDGDGFGEGGGSRPGSFGLLGMEERARLIGARLSIESAPGEGTEISVRLPLGRPAGVGGRV